MAKSIVDYRASGAVILERLAGMELPSGLRSLVSDFRNQHRALEAASRQVETVRAARDQAIARLGKADEALDESNARLADRMVGAGLGARTRPFARIGGPAVSALNDMAYAEETKAVRALGKSIEKLKPPALVKRAVAECLKRADAVTQAIRALAKPQLEYERALHARDALLPTWERSLRRLKRHAAVVWEEDEATYAAIFAPPSSIERPVHRRAAAKKGNGQTPEPPAPPAATAAPAAP